MVNSIPEMHKHIEELNSYFSQTTTTFIAAINAHPGQFTPADHSQFKDLIVDIRNEAMQRIQDFFNNKHGAKSELYDSKIVSYETTSQSINGQLVQFRSQLEEATIEMKKEQNRRENLLDSFSQKYSEHIVYKKVWKLLDENRQERKRAKQMDRKMDLLYQRNLFKKAFFPWRTLTYKEGYENTVRRETEKDITSIHEQYQSIIDILKAKIGQTDDMIKVKRAAKGQFAFALSKNLLKTISNLSMEVMSLNQMSLRDGECDENETKHFMKTVDNVITEKLSKVREYKRTILGEQNDGDDKAKKKKRITFL